MDATTSVRYCQEMSFTVGYMILITKNEKESFSLLDALAGRILANYYSTKTLGPKTDQEALGELVRTLRPVEEALTVAYGILWTLVMSTDSPTCLWTSCLWIWLLRIWDCLFNEDLIIIFWVALT